MKYEDFLTAAPYGAFDYNKALKDEILVGKNLGTSGAPVYGAGSVKGLLIEDLFLNFELPFNSKLTFSAGQIKTGNSIPIEIVPALAGYFIDPISVLAQYGAGAVAFDDPGGLMTIQCAGTGEPLFTTGPGFITDLVNKQIKMKADILTSLPVLVPGSALEVLFSGDSAVGDGEIIIYLSYRLVKV